MAVPFHALNPSHGIRIRCGAKLSSGNAAEVVGDHIVIADAAFVAVNTLEEFDQIEAFDFQSSFFANFAGDCLGKCFTDFEHASRQGPVAFERFMAPAHQQDAAAVDDDSADADKRGRRKFALRLGLSHAKLVSRLAGRSLRVEA